jgi:hypothetical protein
MKLRYMVVYRYRENLREDDLRRLTKEFLQFGTAPGVISHYERMDGKGGYILQEVPDDLEVIKESMLRYAAWIDFDVVLVTTLIDAFPAIQRVYG